MMINYTCTGCGSCNCRLWRQYQTVLNHIELKCIDCALEEYAKDHPDKPLPMVREYPGGPGDGDQIGWLIPAVPTSENDTFWGYSSVPQDRVDWWYSLPLRDVGEPVN
jgi:hypothetical protein